MILRHEQRCRGHRARPLVGRGHGTANGKLGEATTWALPRQSGGARAYGHDLTPVHGDPDRLWIVADAGTVQLSKSGAADCCTCNEHFGRYKDADSRHKTTWAVPAY
ncbi:hypothetical protein [Streptomyces sp. SID13726]|uniref:hypothetical protein n=1 Tax=Streptomyces sp. SID13726 TaxID=2706058 RepID=UPI0013B649E4|nr:hypothetical protein [Streptomyces sp. SID13726]NEA98527.1 hypothetical protein [Streptomyces sp. SID13726]